MGRFSYLPRCPRRGLQTRTYWPGLLSASGIYAVLLVEQSGQITPAHDRAEQLLAQLAADPSAFGGLRDWARTQRRTRPHVATPLRLVGDQSSSELEARYLHGDAGALDAIAIRKYASTAPLAMSALGLTRRQAEVLHLVLRGDTNAAIASTLSISKHTVRHHLEDIYRRLGVSSRVGAPHAASGFWPIFAELAR
jgi:DNA-binding CsgD family transcriptional regulator